MNPGVDTYLQAARGLARLALAHDPDEFNDAERGEIALALRRLAEEYAPRERACCAEPS
ncbi:hypothetical protein [Mycobacterium sp. 1164985.4]|uniref:hypothetical protein n=1 Tax=Mycobacterium sp. 1164985.4 TaxID=1834069 RepID=UPI000B1F44AC|nr:hypothetical protein [Mycobacterium sp. 1164985.4]